VAFQTVSEQAVSERKGPPIGRYLTWAVLCLLLLATLFPFWIALKTALTPQRELFSAPGALLPHNPTLFNFERVLGLVSIEEIVAAGGGASRGINFPLFLRNTVIFTGVIVVFQTFFSAMAAYAFARMRFPGRNLVFYAYLSALMIPSVVLFIPNFILIRELGWLNTFQGMIAPYFFMTPFAVFFLRQFFLGVPRELEEAAYLDGASAFGTFWRVILPISKTPLVTLAILTSINMWNEFFWPFLVGRDENVRVLTVALQFFQTQQPQGAPDWTGLMAGTFLSVIPIFIVMIVLGRQVINSLQFSGLK
jgi:multiple sugar transport system permease protein